MVVSLGINWDAHSTSIPSGQTFTHSACPGEDQGWGHWLLQSPLEDEVVSESKICLLSTTIYVIH